MCTTGGETQSQKQQEFSRLWRAKASPPHGTTRGGEDGLAGAPGLGSRPPSLEQLLLDPGWRGRCLLPRPCCTQAIRQRAFPEPGSSGTFLPTTLDGQVDEGAVPSQGSPQEWTLSRGPTLHFPNGHGAPGRRSSPGLWPQDIFSGPGRSSPEMRRPYHALSCDL